MKNKFIKLLAVIMVLTLTTMYVPFTSLADEEISQEVESEMNIESDDNPNDNGSIDDSTNDENDESYNNEEIDNNDNNIEDNIDDNVNNENDNEQQENKTSDESEISDEKSGELSDENITVFSLDEDSDFDETQTETETIENVTNVTNDDAWNNACQEDQYTRIYGQKAEDGSINYENLKNFDVANNTVVSRPTKYFVEVTANNKAVLVPKLIYETFAKYMSENGYSYNSVIKHQNGIDGKGVSITDTTNPMPVVYWQLNESNLIDENTTYYYATENGGIPSEMLSGKYFVGYTFKHEADGYHIDGILYEYEKEEESSEEETTIEEITEEESSDEEESSTNEEESSEDESSEEITTEEESETDTTEQETEEITETETETEIEEIEESSEIELSQEESSEDITEETSTEDTIENEETNETNDSNNKEDKTEPIIIEETYQTNNNSHDNYSVVNEYSIRSVEPVESTTTIVEEIAPLAETIEETSTEDTTIIGDDDVALTDSPKTGDDTIPTLPIAGISLLFFIGAIVTRKFV